MPRFALLAALLLAAGCSDQGLRLLPDGTIVVEDDEPAEDPTPEQEPDEDPTPTPDPDPVTCEDWDEPDWIWLASPPFSDEADPSDAAGLPFWEPGFVPPDWQTIELPDSGTTPQGTDRAYLAVVKFTELPPILHLSLQSDDGLWLWINGEYMGHWGGEWQMEGCVNENAGCVDSVDVPDLDITELLVEGDNLVAARVSNPLQDNWFEVLPFCIEP